MSKKIELTRRRAIGGLVTIGAGAAAAGAGTFAAFTDTETSSGNSVTAGTLDLTVGGGDSDVTVLSLSDAVPGESGNGTIALANTGTVDGTLNVEVSNIASNENGTNDPESTSSAEGSGVELLSAVTMTVTLGSTTLLSDTLDNVSAGSIASGEALNAGSSKDLTIEYAVDSGAGNEIQSDSVTVDFTFTLNQA